MRLKSFDPDILEGGEPPCLKQKLHSRLHLSRSRDKKLHVG